MALGVFACSHVAFAAQVLCPSTFVTDGTAKVSHFGIAGVLSAANLCEYTSPPDNSVVANATNVNAAAFFTKTDWLVVTGFSQLEPSNGQSGSFELATANFPTKEYMVVFKDGRDTNLIGFLLNEELDNEGVATAGKVKIAWTTPFTNPPFTALNTNQQKDVSHYTVFERNCGVTTECRGPGPDPTGDPNGVPVPATLALLGVGLIGLGAMRQRTR